MKNNNLRTRVIRAKTFDENCQYCKGEQKYDAHIILVESEDGHIHVHAPFENRRAMDRLLDVLDDEIYKHRINRRQNPIHEEEGAVDEQQS